MFTLLISLLVGTALHFADRLKLDALLSSSGISGDQNSDDDTLFYDSIGNAPSPLPVVVQQASQQDLHPSYTVELGLTTDAKEADNRIRELSKLGINAFYTPLHQGGRPLFRIRVGIFQDEELALAEANQIKQHNAALEPKVSRL